MSVFRYKAVCPGGDYRRGEVAADTPAAARVALRLAGLGVVSIRPVKEQTDLPIPDVFGWFGNALDSHSRRRRTQVKADLFDSLATMLQSGIPLLEAVASTSRAAPRSSRSMLMSLGDQLKDGNSLSESMRARPGWFSRSEIAMIAAGQHRGELSTVLAGIAQRHERSGELAGKLIGALTYPMAVLMIGIGVVVFLSTKTLPELSGLLEQAGVETPRLTALVMGFGQTLAARWWLLLVAMLAIAIGVGVVFSLARRYQIDYISWLDRVTPDVVRRLLVARLSGELAEMTKAGVPAAESLSVLAPTFGAPFGLGLRKSIENAVSSIERGESLSEALSNPRWFDAQFTALVTAGQASGELDSMLTRLADRETRRAHRLVDRLASLLEPAVILLLAALVGTIAMAAILPLIRLQETL